jgi:hypothetical protein
VIEIDRVDIFEAIITERARQDELHPMPRQKKCSDKDVCVVTNMLMLNEFLAVLVEETGEVASALQGDGDLKEELVQVASVCVRWLESLQ